MVSTKLTEQSRQGNGDIGVYTCPFGKTSEQLCRPFKLIERNRTLLLRLVYLLRAVGFRVLEKQLIWHEENYSSIGRQV